MQQASSCRLFCFYGPGSRANAHTVVKQFTQHAENDILYIYIYGTVNVQPGLGPTFGVLPPFSTCWLFPNELGMDRAAKKQEGAKQMLRDLYITISFSSHSFQHLKVRNAPTRKKQSIMFWGIQACKVFSTIKTLHFAKFFRACSGRTGTCCPQSYTP